MEIFRYLALFFFGGLCGWIIEFFFRRAAHGKWVNPGFLTGPCLPLYGFGVVALYLLTNVVPYDWCGEVWVQYLVKIVFIGITMTVVELIAGLIFIEGMHIKLWDYSTRWGNFKGIICPLFSLIWAVIGAGYVFLLNGPIVQASDWVMSNPLPLLFILGICVGIFFVDLCFSFHFAAKIKKAVVDSNIVVVWERAKETVNERRKELESKVHWFQPFLGNHEEFVDLLEDYRAKIETEIAVRKAKFEAKLEARKSKRK